jgi:hypothetical protein
LSKRYGAERSECKWPLFPYPRGAPETKHKDDIDTRVLRTPARTSTRCCPYLRR